MGVGGLGPKKGPLIPALEFRGREQSVGVGGTQRVYKARCQNGEGFASGWVLLGAARCWSCVGSGFFFGENMGKGGSGRTSTGGGEYSGYYRRLSLSNMLHIG